MSDSGMEGFRKSLAFLVAINRYGNGVPELWTPVADAEALAEALHRDHGYEAEILRDEQATLDGLRAFLTGLKELVKSDDRVIFYFEGHGVAPPGNDGPEGYILPHDAERDSPPIPGEVRAE
jgi:uncharacterized caspase-like protein